MNNRAPDQVRKMKGVVWYGTQSGNTLHGQWMKAAFWRLWEQSITDAFATLGMEDLLITILGTTFKRTDAESEDLIPVRGKTSQRIIEHAMRHIETLTTAFDVVDLGGVRAVQWQYSQDQALEEWGELAGTLARVAVATLVTDQLRHYVRGTEDGYHPSTRHMFVRWNTVEKIGMPYELRWRINMDGHAIGLYGDWERIRKTRDQTW